MFYAHFVLSKKGPLARIWLAAHWDKKLTKAHVFETNISSSVDAILEPKVKMALRTSGHLLLGVVRIYSRKAKYLLADCNEAFVKIKMAFRPGVVDLPEDNREAAVAAITLPETFHDFDTTMADLTDIDVQAQFSVNQSRPEEITMREEIGNITIVNDDGFGDIGFDEKEIMRDAGPIEDALYKSSDAPNLLLDQSTRKDKSADGEKPMDVDFTAPIRDDGFGGGIDDQLLGGPDSPAGCHDDDSSDDDNFGGGMDHDLFTGEDFMESAGLFEEPPAPLAEVSMPDPAVSMVEEPREPPQVEEPEPIPTQPPAEIPGMSAVGPPEMPPPIVPPPPPPAIDQTTLVHNEEEAFALEPLDITSLATGERRTKRKRKLIVDDAKGIPSESMKLQLSDTGDIVTTLDLAPPTKKLMHWKETGGVEKLFALPGRNLPSRGLPQVFLKNLTTKPVTEDEEPDDDRLELEAPENFRIDDDPDEHHLIRDISNSEDRPPPKTRRSRAQKQAEAQAIALAAAEAQIRGANAAAAEAAIQAQEEAMRAQQMTPSMPEPVPQVSFQQPDISIPEFEPPMPELPDQSELQQTINDMPPDIQQPEEPIMSPRAAIMSPRAAIMSPRRVQEQDVRELEKDDEDEIVNDDIFTTDFQADVAAEQGLNMEELTTEERDALTMTEEYEEKRLSKRSQIILRTLHNIMKKRSSHSIGFKEFTRTNHRKQAASKFYTMLVLKKQEALEIKQTEPFGDLILSRGPQFDSMIE
ncbi:double-strand-break repair protein rad21 homolog isoform X3 [Lineus longissimus]|uniref:double-strand-break repair protein rad21 homolog isoform X3 n=1 Tax=Lineus longissimus TaxID=88925 RepID=UPI002B4C89A0